MSESRTGIPLISLALTVLGLVFTSTLGRASGELSDPTRPPGAADSSISIADPDARETTDLELQALLYAEGRRIAIVNGQRVGEGDSVAGARVVSIAADRVHLSRGGEDHVLQIGALPVKRAHRATQKPGAWIGPPPPAPPATPDPAPANQDRPGARARTDAADANSRADLRRRTRE